MLRTRPPVNPIGSLVDCQVEALLARPLPHFTVHLTQNVRAAFRACHEITAGGDDAGLVAFTDLDARGDWNRDGEVYRIDGSLHPVVLVDRTAERDPSSCREGSVDLRHVRGQENLRAFGQNKTVGLGKQMTNYFCST